jgi:hypothetical protein
MGMPKATSAASIDLRRDALVHALHGFVHVGAEHGIDQEARRVLHRQRQLVDPAHEGGGALHATGIGRGALAGHHLDQRHHRHRVEEVDADQACRVLEARRDVGQLERLEVFDAITASGFARASMSAEERLLGFEVLENGLDDDIGLAHAILGLSVTSAIRRSSAKRASFLAIAQLLLEEGLRRATHGRRDALHVLVLQGHGHAAQHAPGGDVAAHDAGADHMHALRCEVSSRFGH